MVENLAKYDKAQLDIPLKNWRFRVYTAGFLVSFLIYLSVHGASQWRAISIFAVAALLIGAWLGYRGWLRMGVTITILFTLFFPVIEEAVMNNESLATVVAKVPVWPQLLVALIGSRVLATECELSFAEFWRQPIRQRTAVEFQSFSAAVAFGAFLTLMFYLAVPRLAPSVRQAQPIIISAMLGASIVHSMIIFLFFVILSLILDAARAYVLDRSVLASFRRCIETGHAGVASHGLRFLVAGKLSFAAHTRAVQLIRAAIERAERKPAGSQELTALSLDCFHQASRQFVRALLPFLPLLGFLGTVIGLATAIGELPRSVADQSVRSFDVSASLAGLAIKFETTLLGLIASMVSSFLLNILEKRESELTAECMLIVSAAENRDA